MIQEINYTNINRVLDDLLDHPMLTDLSLEQVVKYTLKFISKHGYTKLYGNKEAEVDIEDFRGVLPCDLIGINQVKDCKSGVCLRAMTDTFNPQSYNKISGIRDFPELSFKTQNRIIYTSFPEGKILISYKNIPVDDEGFPMVIDNETYLDALEAYIKVKVFTVKFDQQKIPVGVLQNAQTDYATAAKLLQSEFTLPSVSEMQAIANMWNTLIPKVREFDNGFRNLGDREYLVRHNNKH